MLLPKIFEDRNGKYPALKGKPKLSYSQYTSYKDPEYQPDYYVQYFSGAKLPSGEFADFGSACGEFIEAYAQGEIKQGLLSEEDMEILKKEIEYLPNCVYEDEVGLDLGGFVIEGYIDRTHYTLNDEKEIDITDFKTLNIEKKSAFYASEEYGQTTLYCRHKEDEGFKIRSSQVVGLGRKGSSLSGKGNFKMRLSGEVVVIPTPYTRERSEKVLDDIRKVAKEIAEDYRVFLKYFS